MRHYILLLAWTAAVLPVSAQLGLYEGFWQGNLEINNIPMDIVLHIHEGTDGRPRLDLDIPGHGVEDFKADELLFHGDSITFGWSVSSTLFHGALDGPDVLEGIWSIREQDLKLEFERLEDGIYRRPQEPSGTLPYESIDVSFPSSVDDDVQLAGTLTIPRGARSAPAVVLITGSGAQDRDEAVYGHRPFLVIADRLTRAGIAVLRFDDRGTAGSTGTFETADTRDFALDAIGAVHYLQRQSDFKPTAIGLMGHTEGGTAAIIGATLEEIDFIVLLATAGIANKEILIEQSVSVLEQSGTPESLIRTDTMFVRNMYNSMSKWTITDPDTVAFRAMTEAYFHGSELIRTRYKTADEFYKSQLRLVTSPWFHFYATFDPDPLLRAISCPVLAIHGSTDAQLDADRNLDAIAQSLKAGGNKNHEVRNFEGLNHFFQPAEGFMAAEYGTISVTWDESVLAFMAEWINGAVR